MKTKPIDYTGCHPAIKEQLSSGRAIWCVCWRDSDCYKRDKNYTEWVIGYDVIDGVGLYLVSNMEDGFMYAEPIETKRVLKDPVSLLKVMIEHGAIFDNQIMAWIMQYNDRRIILRDFSKCGKEWSGATLPDYFYEEIECVTK